eukprot:4900706-Karenia_brevis.AAC.2
MPELSRTCPAPLPLAYSPGFLIAAHMPRLAWTCLAQLPLAYAPGIHDFPSPPTCLDLPRLA